MLNKRKKAREWARHCAEMQNELNENNWERYGWYVSRGELCFNWMKHRDYGNGLIVKLWD